MKHLGHETTEKLRFQQKEHSETTTESKHIPVRSAIQSLGPQEAMGALERRLLQINKGGALLNLHLKQSNKVSSLEWHC